MKSIKITIDGESHVSIKDEKIINNCYRCSLVAECRRNPGLICRTLGLEVNEYFEKEKTESQKRIDAYTEDEYHNLEPEE